MNTEHSDGLDGRAELVAFAQRLRAERRRRLPEELADSEYVHSNRLATCRESRVSARTLRRQIVKHRRIPESIEGCLLPAPPSGWSLLELGLRRSTRDALAAEGFDQDVSVLGELSVAQILMIPGLGTRELIELLDALERHVAVNRLTLEQSEPLDVAVLRELESVSTIPGVLQLSGDDPRLGKSVRDIDRSAGSLGLLFLRAFGYSLVPFSLEKVEQLLELCRRIRDFCAYSIEREFFDICFPRARGRNRDLIATYFGFRTSVQETLESVGSRFSITRERVRQIISKARCFDPSAQRAFAPSIDRALQLIGALVPRSATEIQRILVEQGLLPNPMTVDAVIKVAAFLQRDPSIATSGHGDSKLVLTEADARASNHVRSTAERVLSKVGATTIADIVERTQDPNDAALSEANVLLVLETTNGFRWLDKSSGWFCVENGRYNSLRWRIRRVLAVAPRIQAGELRNAIRRDYRYEGVAPPTRVLIEFCRAIPECSVDGDTIVASDSLSGEDLLEGDDGIIARLLLERGPLCQRESLQQLAINAGVSSSSFWRCASYSPLLVRYGRGVYGLVGAEVNPGAVEALIRQRQASRVTKDHGWTSEGNVWIAYRASEGTIESGVVSVPVAKRDHVQGQFRLTASHGGVEAGNLTVKGASAWGLGPYLRRNGVEEGDYFVLVFYVSERMATVTIGDAGMLEQFQDAMGN